MLTIRLEKPSDAAAPRGAARRWPTDRSASRSPPSGCAPAASRRAGCRFVAVEDGRVIGTVRLWEVAAGPACPALLLGPLAVDPAHRCRGIGSALMRHALARRRPARPSRRAAGRRRVVLRPLRLLGRADRRAVAAGPRRQEPSARPRTRRRRARRRARRDPRADASQQDAACGRGRQASPGPTEAARLSLRKRDRLPRQTGRIALAMIYPVKGAGRT